ncbi:MAG TPA: NADH-quinone oxidoreductase subunit A [Blastocatellia bacterium]|nr:NADH-quinone oxidoreductase subunit A [Blastocatellia bacterium]
MNQPDITNYGPILIIFLIAALLVTAILIVSKIAGRNRPTKRKLEPYECGVEPVGSAHERQSVKFYLVAMVFLLFDIEAAFLVPWAAVFSDVLEDPTYSALRYIFYGEMMVFMVVLFVGLVYVWKKGVLDWSR